MSRGGRAPAAVAGAALVAWTLLAPARAAALDLWRSDDGLRGLELTPSLKVFSFGIAMTPDGPPGHEDLWPVPDVGGGDLIRLRLRLLADLHPRVRAVFHYEQRPRIMSNGRLMFAVSGALQGDEDVPFRLTPLLWTIAESDVPPAPEDALVGPANPTFTWQHEIDRALFVFSLPLVDVTVGRQAIGWGLGRFFSPLDLFAPLSPTDLDREERRGVDALRLTAGLGPTAFFEVVAVGGTERGDDGELEITWRSSALASLLRFEAFGVDFLLAAGKVGPDRVIGAGVSGQLAGVTVRGEVTDTETEEHERYARATVGVEFGTPFNLMGVVEYHYNGFGVLDPAVYLRQAVRLSRRLATGQISGLGQHYLGASLSWQPGAWGGLSLIYIQNLTDGSLTVGPSVEYVLCDAVRLAAVALIPVGARPRWETGASGLPEMVPRSEFGLGAQMYVLQIRAAI